MGPLFERCRSAKEIKPGTLSPVPCRSEALCKSILLDPLRVIYLLKVCLKTGSYRLLTQLTLAPVWLETLASSVNKLWQGLFLFLFLREGSRQNIFLTQTLFQPALRSVVLAFTSDNDLSEAPASFQDCYSRDNHDI